jgi:hypothetical protein
MANEYATLAQAKARLMNKVTVPEESELEGIIEAASRAIDDYLEVYEGYFTPPSALSVKNIKGNGSPYMNLPAPLYGTVTIESTDGVTIPNYTVEGMKLLTLNENDVPNPFIVWQAVYYSIEGNWGYAVIPAQIREACLQLVVHFWRGRDKSLTGTVTDMRQDEQFPERDFPRMTRRILDDFKYKLGDRASGGLVIA